VTKTEQAIVELEKSIAVLEERLDIVFKSSDSLIEMERRLTYLEQNVRLSLLEENVKEMKKEREKKDGRLWTIVVALVSCFLTLTVQLLLSYIKTGK
jgi:hypothetical protein